MIFISRYKNYQLGIRPTIRQVVHGSTGGEEVIVHKGVIVQFNNAMFDTKDWQQYSRPESPDHINVIKTEDDLIRLMKAHVEFGNDFFERKIETAAQKKAKLREELARLEAEGSADNPDNAPEMQVVQPEVTEITIGKKAKKTAEKPAKKRHKGYSKILL